MKNKNVVITVLLVIIVILGIFLLPKTKKINNDNYQVSYPDTINHNEPIPASQTQGNSIDSTNSVSPLLVCSSNTAPWIKIVSPNGGEVFTMGQSIKITWKTCNAKSDQTVSLSIRKLLLPSEDNGISGGWKYGAAFYPTQTANDGTETVTLGAASTNGKWNIPAESGYEIFAVLNPSPSDTQETAYTSDVSDATFTIQSNTIKYSDTVESKVVSEESPAYLTGFEKRSDGYYYLSFDYLQVKPGQGFVNENTKIRTFRADPQMKIYQSDNESGNPTVYKTFDNYSLLLKKEGSHLINPEFVDQGKPNGVYYVYIKNGLIIKINEFYDHEIDG